MKRFNTKVNWLTLTYINFLASFILTTSKALIEYNIVNKQWSGFIYIVLSLFIIINIFSFVLKRKDDKSKEIQYINDISDQIDLNLKQFKQHLNQIILLNDDTQIKKKIKLIFVVVGMERLYQANNTAFLIKDKTIHYKYISLCISFYESVFYKLKLEKHDESKVLNKIGGILEELQDRNGEWFLNKKIAEINLIFKDLL